MANFDWHKDRIAQETPVTPSCRNTRNVRRFFKAEFGSHFKFDYSSMAWLEDGKPETMDDTADEWLRKNMNKSP